MTNQKRSRQNWWHLYVAALLIVGLLILAHYLAPSPGWRIFLEVGVVIVGYGVIMMWVEIHSTALLHRPTTEVDSQVVELLDGEMPSLTSPPIRLYIGADPAIIYGMPEHPTGSLNSNGHRPARTMPSLPEETLNN